MKNEDIKKLSDKFIESHRLPTIDVPEPNFTSANGAINYWEEHTAKYHTRGMTIEEVKSLLLKILVRYRNADNINDI